MNRSALVLALLAPLGVAADTQKKTDPAPKKAATPAKETGDSRTRDISRLLGMLGMPKANSEAARRQLAAAAKDPKLTGFPEAYWKEYNEAASPRPSRSCCCPSTRRPTATTRSRP